MLTEAVILLDILLALLPFADLPITLSLTLTPTLSPLVLTAGEELVLRCSPAPGSEVTSLVWQRGAETLSIGVSQDNSGILFTIASVQVRICVHTCVCVHVCAYVRACVHVCMHMYMYVCACE